MQTPTARLLELLELLQERPLTTGREIADRLEIDARTVRRYIEALQGLGIPVEGQRGVGGGYRVRPGAGKHACGRAGFDLRRRKFVRADWPRLR